MSEIVRYVFGVIVLSIVLNLVSSYLKPFTDRFISTWWRRRLDRKVARDAAYRAVADMLAGEHHRQTMVAYREQQYQFIVLRYLIVFSLSAMVTLFAGLQFQIYRISGKRIPHVEIGPFYFFTFELIYPIMTLVALLSGVAVMYALRSADHIRIGLRLAMEEEDRRLRESAEQ